MATIKTIEEKAKAYDEIIEKANKMHHENCEACQMCIEELIPELKESEDEKIRKEIKDFFLRIMLGQENFLREDYDWNAWIAWLEKQGEQKLDDKVEPKFHVGEWVFIEEIKGFKNGPFQIKTVDSLGYSFDEYHIIPLMYEELLSKWTIQDAKDGDVLVDRYGNIGIFEKTFGLNWHSYCYLGCNGDFMHSNVGGSHDLVDTYPTTKEQRNLLFSKMREAGYVWDAEKKELKMIEQKSAWSKEDESWFKEIELMCLNFSNDTDYRENFSTWLKSLKDRVQPKQKWSEEDEKKIESIIETIRIRKFEHPQLAQVYEGDIEWLKSLRPQNRWKPSDEQMHYLSWIANVKLGDSVVEQDVSKHLNELLKDLKKLREK